MKVFFFALFSVLVVGCASNSLQTVNRSDYENYLDRHLQVSRLYDHGRELVVAKAVKVTSELKAEQEKVLPKFSVELSDRSQIILALSTNGREFLSTSELKFFVDGDPIERIQEITNQNVIERLYPFAFPFHKVYLITYPLKKGAAQNFEIYTTAGTVKMGAIE